MTFKTSMLNPKKATLKYTIPIPSPLVHTKIILSITHSSHINSKTSPPPLPPPKDKVLTLLPPKKHVF